MSDPWVTATDEKSAIEEAREFLQPIEKIRDGSSFVYIYAPHALRMIAEFDALAAELAALKDGAE
jgi:hypothetical protein